MPKILLSATMMLFVMSIFASPLFAESGPTVTFDQGHGQRFLIGEEGPLHFKGLADEFRKQGLKVTALSEELTAEALAGSGALVISGPFASFKPGEIDAVTKFIEGGGKVAIMLHIGAPLVPLLDRLGVVVSGSSIHERENLINADELCFRATSLEPHDLSRGLEHIRFYGAWGLLNEGAGTAILASTSDKAWIDLNGDRKLSAEDVVQKFAVAVTGVLGKGRFVVFGDDAVFQNQYLNESNLQLATNLATWLK